MSTKIYYGYRVELKKWNAFLESFHKRCIKNAVSLVRDLMKACDQFYVTKELKEKYESHRKAEGVSRKYRNLKQFKEAYEKRVRFDFVMEGMQKVSETRLRVDTCIDAELVCWVKGSHIYTYFIGEPFLLQGFKCRDLADNYSYWDNTDKPRNINHNIWNLRRADWHECLNMYNNRLYCSIIKISEDVGYYEIDCGVKANKR